MTLTTIRLREAWNWGGLTFKQLLVHTYKEMDRHVLIDRAAVVAYYAMLALVPFLGFMLTLAAVVKSGAVADQLLTVSRQVLPKEGVAIISDQIQKIQESPPVTLLSISFLVMLWSSSSLFVAVMDATNAAYGVRDERPWWKRRLMAIVLTVCESVLVLGALISIVAWPQIVKWIGLGVVAATVATIVQWCIVVVVLLATFAIAFFFGPHVDQEWEWITPGSALGVLVLILASLGFRLYVQYGSSYSATYGALAGVIILLLWLFIAALALLVGAEINCVVEHAAPHGKDPGRKASPQTEKAEQKI